VIKNLARRWASAHRGSAPHRRSVVTFCCCWVTWKNKFTAVGRMPLIRARRLVRAGPRNRRAHAEAVVWLRNLKQGEAGSRIRGFQFAFPALTDSVNARVCGKRADVGQAISVEGTVATTNHRSRIIAASKAKPGYCGAASKARRLVALDSEWLEYRQIPGLAVLVPDLVERCFNFYLCFKIVVVFD
jgi:hypothetical protein